MARVTIDHIARALLANPECTTNTFPVHAPIIASAGIAVIACSPILFQELAYSIATDVQCAVISIKTVFVSFAVATQEDGLVYASLKIGVAVVNGAWIFIIA